MNADERLRELQRRDPEATSDSRALVLIDRVERCPCGDITAMANQLQLYMMDTIVLEPHKDFRPSIEQMCRGLLVAWLERDGWADEIITVHAKET